jgi:uncharacterized protein
MSVIELSIRALIPTRAGCAVFLGHDDKVIHFFIELSIGQAINEYMAGETFPRPMTFDTVNALMTGFGARMTKVVINDYEDEVYYAKMYWMMENEIESKKIVELDTRPSDALALAVRQKAPLFIKEEVWDALEDMSPLLEDLKNQTEE